MRELVLVVLIIGVLACGKAAVDGQAGVDGLNGLPGAQGASGATTSCTVTQTTVGVIIACPDGSNAVVLHGQNCVLGKPGK